MRTIVPWVAGALASLLPLCAQESPRPWRLVAFFWHESPNDAEALVGIRAGLEIWGRPFALEVLQADEDPQRAEELLTRVRAQQPDLVFALGTRAALLCKEALPALPVVFTAVTHPLESGVVPSWAGSASQLCGNSNWIGSHRLMEVFHLAVPGLSRLGVLRSRSAGVVSGAEVAGMRRHLADTGADVRILEEVVDDAQQIGAATRRLIELGADAVWVPIDFLIYENMQAVLDAARPQHVPLVSSSLRGTRAGAVAGVVVDYGLLGRRSVLYALDVLERGKDPAVLPVGTMESYRVVVNLGAARAIGYEPPLSLLVLADQIIEDREVQGGR